MAAKIVTHRVPLIQRFWSKVEVSDDCWLWTSDRKDTGYGQFHYLGKTSRAHRVAWILSYGDIPPGLNVLHTCDNPPCVRPDHLFLGTTKDNIEDKVTKGRAWGGRRLAWEDVCIIRASGSSAVDVAEEFSVSRSLVSMIRTGRIWPRPHHDWIPSQ
ncbi:MAG TPA: HNH endonuclease signature motif containing protein [Verrucomicrobiae bacterium]|nr:HNH endonuclease signature motif containing protein [Verrucomicrobiae bacterium]